MTTAPAYQHAVRLEDVSMAFGNVDAIARRQHAAVAEGADAVTAMRGIAEEPAHEGLAHLAGGAGDEDEAGGGHGTAVVRRRGP